MGRFSEDEHYANLADPTAAYRIAVSDDWEGLGGKVWVLYFSAPWTMFTAISTSNVLWLPHPAREPAQ
ncbi:hypothetical protein H4S14_002302 [Agrobacterium vitis]|nr:hypothetical protein [Agrobacterium vitis]MBE1438552.1 hypothetical protein [Agrobacterium vitis]